MTLGLQNRTNFACGRCIGRYGCVLPLGNCGERLALRIVITLADMLNNLQSDILILRAGALNMLASYYHIALAFVKYNVCYCR